MSVVMARIDNRLLHGIIVTQWAPVSGATRVMVIDDKVAGDEVLKSTMRMARPAGMAVSIISEQTALKNFAAGKYDREKVFVIAKEPETMLRLVESGVELPSRRTASSSPSAPTPPPRTSRATRRSSPVASR